MVENIAMAGQAVQKVREISGIVSDSYGKAGARDTSNAEEIEDTNQDRMNRIQAESIIVMSKCYGRYAKIKLDISPHRYRGL